MPYNVWIESNKLKLLCTSIMTFNTQIMCKHLSFYPIMLPFGTTQPFALLYRKYSGSFDWIAHNRIILKYVPLLSILVNLFLDNEKRLPCKSVYLLPFNSLIVCQFLNKYFSLIYNCKPFIIIMIIMTILIGWLLSVFNFLEQSFSWWYSIIQKLRRNPILP